MISKTSSSECFVYIMLPGETRSVTAGRLVYTTDQHGSNLGQFVYGKKYLARPNAVAIDPVDLELTSNIYETTQYKGLFGAFRDSSPDRWGRVVIEKHAHRAQLSELGYLLESPDDRAGALGFGLGKEPPAPQRHFNKTLELEKLQKVAQSILQEEIGASDSITTQVEELMLVRTSMGGERPKAVVEDEAGLWIAKFSKPKDRWNNPRVEHAMLQLARKCGIDAALSRIETVGGNDVLLVKRFDRERVGQRSYLRARMISALTVLRAEEWEHELWSYVSLAEELRRIVAEPEKDAAELFRRMCFNALISNLDDHPRNHAIIALDLNWRLSPAYDLTPSPVISEEHRDLAMSCGDFGRFANARNFLSQASRFMLSAAQAEHIISEMSQQIKANWYRTVRSVGVSEIDADTIRRAFEYAGFWLDPGLA
jgi:serine/threonine-protein kinase HipA